MKKVIDILAVCVDLLQKFYDIYGVDRANGVVCGNTILCFYYNPLYSFGDNGEFIKNMAEIGGKVCSYHESDE